MYGLLHACKIANERLIKRLEPYGYTPSKLTPGLWTHATRSTDFTLVVDNFGIKHTGIVIHLLTALREQYKITHTTQAHYTVESPWNGITTNNMSMFPYQNMSIRHYNDLAILPRPNLNIPLIDEKSPSMARKCNTPSPP